MGNEAGQRTPWMLTLDDATCEILNQRNTSKLPSPMAQSAAGSVRMEAVRAVRTGCFSIAVSGEVSSTAFDGTSAVSVLGTAVAGTAGLLVSTRTAWPASVGAGSGVSL